MGDITQVMEGMAGKEHNPADELLPLVYDELRKLAAARMAGESGTQTLQPTALVHEAWLRLAGSQESHWKNRGHFFAAAAEAMRRILIERARSKHTLKRGSNTSKINLDQVDIAVETDAETLLMLNDALEILGAQYPVAAEIVKLRFFVGLDYVQAAEAMGISLRSAKRYWSFARAWLYRQLSSTA